LSEASDSPTVEGTVRPITRWGEPVMHRRLKRVSEFGDDLRSLVADMWATMYAADGVGLAANQIGIDRAVFVFDCPDDNQQMVKGVVCNPVVVSDVGPTRDLTEGDEGCLSLPGAFVELARPSWVRVEGFDEHGSPVAYEGDGLLARCLQHESDHLEGRVFGDRLPARARKKLYKRHESMAEHYPADWPVTPAIVD
jgi:peptide deformylase